ncbi:hypothetical protein [Nostoc edaphicum]|uniref:hypothetical protein n=1 Tax=Nostoc edaphicum TaxID=264686 RepID=UPI001D134307|nr:hypothetical protein [Nostoc edaphicum]
MEPKDLNNLVTDRTNRAILTGMKLDPKERPQSMREWLDSLGLTGETPQPVSTVSFNTNSNWERKIQVWGVVIAAIAAIGGILAGMGAMAGWIPYFNSPPSSNPPSLSPSPSSTKTP